MTRWSRPSRRLGNASTPLHYQRQATLRGRPAQPTNSQSHSGYLAILWPRCTTNWPHRISPHESSSRCHCRCSTRLSISRQVDHHYHHRCNQYLISQLSLDYACSALLCTVIKPDLSLIVIINSFVTTLITLGYVPALADRAVAHLMNEDEDSIIETALAALEEVEPSHPSLQVIDE